MTDKASSRYDLRFFPAEFIDRAIDRLTDAYPEWREKYLRRLTDDDEYYLDENGEYVYKFKDDISRFVSELASVSRILGVEDEISRNNFTTDIINRILQMIEPEVQILQELKRQV